MKKIMLLLLACSVPLAAFADTLSASDTIDQFYRAYMPYVGKPNLTAPAPAFSKAFLDEKKQDARLCKQYAQGDICGFGADSDPYLDAQEWDDHLTYTSAKVKVVETSPGIVSATFNLSPSGKMGKATPTVIYHMLQEGDVWTVDDICYRDAKLGTEGYCARAQMKSEIELLQSPKHGM